MNASDGSKGRSGAGAEAEVSPSLLVCRPSCARALRGLPGCPGANGDLPDCDVLLLFMAALSSASRLSASVAYRLGAVRGITERQQCTQSIGKHDVWVQSGVRLLGLTAGLTYVGPCDEDRRISDGRSGSWGEGSWNDRFASLPSRCAANRT